MNVYLDNKFGFGIDLDTYVKLGLKVEQELSESEVAEIVEEVELSMTRDKIINYGIRRPRSEREYEEWMRKKKVHSSLWKSLKQNLRKLDLLDDQKFASWWVEQRLSFKPRGKRALMVELRHKGIDKGVIDKTLSEADINESKIAVKLVSRRAYKWKRYSGEEKRRKMGEYLARKGFNWEIIRSVIENE